MMHLSLETEMFIDFVCNCYSLHLNTFTGGSRCALPAFRHVQSPA